MINASNAILIIVKHVHKIGVQIVLMDMDLFIMMKAFNTHVNVVNWAVYNVMVNKKCVLNVMNSIIYRILFA